LRFGFLTVGVGMIQTAPTVDRCYYPSPKVIYLNLERGYFT